MDDIDRNIIRHIQGNGRASYAEIGAAVGLSVSAVNDRLRKLQAQGAVTGWAARIDPAALGLDVLAFVQVLLDRPEHTAPFVGKVCTLPQIQECHHVTGAWSYLLKIRTPGIAALERLLAEDIKSLPGVIRTETVIALSTPKETPSLPVE